MSALQKIADLLPQLTVPERTLLLEQLKSELPPEISVADFAALIQKMYRKSISFDIITKVEGRWVEITATIETPIGSFSATGANQVLAKHAATQKAMEAFNLKNSGQAGADKK